MGGHRVVEAVAERPVPRMLLLQEVQLLALTATSLALQPAPTPTSTRPNPNLPIPGRPVQAWMAQSIAAAPQS